jgi:tripartite-type tricarboxylate transporter receptor subunit TctC
MHHPSRVTLSLLTAALLCAVATSNAQTGAYPDRPVKLITASAGSPQDVVGRIVGQRLGEKLGQPVVIDNRAGTGSLLSITATMRAPADGYTLLLSSTAYAVTPSLMANAGYDALKDFVPIVHMAETPNVFIADNALPVADLKEAIALSRTRELQYASPGVGTTPQLSADYVFRFLGKGQVAHIPYRGAPPAVAAAAGGQVNFTSAALPAALPLIKAGRVKALATTGTRRSSQLPQVPTVAESGYPGFRDSTWVGLWAPVGTPRAVIDRVAEAVAAILKEPEVVQRLADAGFETEFMGPAAFSTYVSEEVAKWARVVKETGAKME